MFMMINISLLLVNIFVYYFQLTIFCSIVYTAFIQKVKFYNFSIAYEIMSSNKETTKTELKNVQNKSKLPLILSLLVLLGIIGAGSWYLLKTPNKQIDNANTSSTDLATIKPGNPQTPTETYKKLYAAVKSKNKEEIKSLMSKDSIGLAQMQAGQSKKEIDEVLANAFTTTTFASSLPPIRDERIKGKFGSIEVFSQKSNRWEDLPFVIEDGAWKLAVGNLFAGTFQSPGKSRSIIEKENANAAGQTDMVPYGNGNINMNSANVTIIDPLKDGKVPTQKKPK